MLRSQPRQKRYSGRIILESQPKNWIRQHRSFAFREWINSQIEFGTWIKESNKPGKYLIYPIVGEGRKKLAILIKITHYPQGSSRYPFDHVKVNHTHILREKGKRRKKRKKRK